MLTGTYIRQAISALKRLERFQSGNISKAADLMAGAIAGNRSIFSFGATHSFILTEEMVYRTGGLMLVNPIYPQGMNLLVRPMTLTSKLERVEGVGNELLEASPAKCGDVLIITSTSGRNAVAIDMAIAAAAKKMLVIGITALAYSRKVKSRHSSKKKLADLCDVVIDNGAPYGDAVVAIPGFKQKVSPLSSLTGIAIVNSLVAEVVDRLVRQGIAPPVFISANIDGADEYNRRLLAANAGRIYYM